MSNVESKRALFNRLNLLNDLIEIRPVAGLQLGMKELTIGVNFECATA